MSTLSPVWPVLWSLCGLVAVAGAIEATRRPAGRGIYVGRAAVGVLFIFGGALVHALNLANGSSYRSFADPAHFAWVRTTWRAVVPPNQTALIALLTAFELAVGLAVLSGGHRTELGLVAAIGFHALLWIFGWIESIYCLVMIPTLVALCRAERLRARRPAVRETEGLGPPLAA